jgi:hypothetical protein
MKTFILSADYELFLGSRTGTVKQCMIEPTDKLAELLDINNSKMTVFWDILHYYRLSELESDNQSLRDDKRLIEQQISSLISKGHDIQLHIHPHWLDAKYEDGAWKFKYDRFKLHTLSGEENFDKIDTIAGCIRISKQLMENQVRKYAPGYNVTTFRAGGYLIEPFAKLKSAFERNNIYVDSSILPGMSKDNSINGYDFTNYPEHNHFKFSSSPFEPSTDGMFTEIPITTFKIPIHKNILFTLIRRFKYPDLERGRMGTGSSDSGDDGEDSNAKKIFKILTKPKRAEFTTDGNFDQRFNYMYRKAKNNSTMILHPKLLNQHTLRLLKEKLLNNDIKFISINNYMKSIG